MPTKQASPKRYFLIREHLSEINIRARTTTGSDCGSLRSHESNLIRYVRLLFSEFVCVFIFFFEFLSTKTTLSKYETKCLILFPFVLLF